MTRLPAALLAAVALLAGCDIVGESPETRFFTLGSVPAEGPPTAAPGAPLVVDAVEIPEALERPELVRRQGDYRIEVSDVDRWAAPLAAMIRDVLIDDLVQRMPPGQVAVAGRPGEVWPARTLVVTLHDFAPAADGRVRLDAAWVVLAGQDEEPSARGREEISVAGGPGADGQAEGMSRALGELADRIVAELARAGS